MRLLTHAFAASACIAASPALVAPAFAWEFSPAPICTLSYAEAAQVEVTYDARLPEYAIHITSPEGWVDAPVFSLRFEGPRGGTISTDRHTIEGDTLTVRDTGFGNVLYGLQLNTTAVAVLGGQEVEIDLAGAADPVQAFRGCPADLSV
jgi:hypothetical protein